MLLGISLMGYSQQKPRVVFDHQLSSSSFSPNARQQFIATRTFPETLRVLCAMVEFQEDNDGRTNGNGRFDLSDTLPRVIDPAPHNKQYFEHHLTFAQNYFRKASDGKFIVVGDVLDSVYRVPNQMPYYSPPRSSNDNTKLGLFMNDAWRVVDSVTPGIQYGNYDAFIIFHAGAGRDVASDIKELDPSPFDIPSIYLNLPTLQTIFGSTYQGVPVADSSYFIKNTMILPETESRKVSTILGSYLLQLGINGLLVASIGSHLGLPDLFDTKTGRTGIGRFGLMDGQSIFSWFGVFPPEPSAWEKTFLGWANPITVSSGDSLYSLPAVSKSGQEDTIYKVLISAKEYFLLENRNRDADSNGVTITYSLGGNIYSKTWYRDTTNFNAYDIDSLYGTIINVDEFDWSLPGGVNTKTNEWFNGGALIWHIDEHVIEANLQTNSVNANPDHRGVDLEEADGSQDIGQSYEFLEPGAGSEDGTALDFWYSGNTAPVRNRKNFFTPTTFPNSNSYAGANSHVYLKDFSARKPQMTVKIQVGDDVKPLDGFPKYIGGDLKNSSIHAQEIAGGSSIIVLSTDSSIFSWNVSQNTPLFPTGNQTGIIAQSNSNCQQGFFGTGVLKDVGGDGQPEIVQSENACHLSSHGSLVSYWSLKDTNSDGTSDKTKEFVLDYNSTVTSPVASDSFIAFGLSDGLISFNKSDGTHIEVSLTADTSEHIVGMSLFAQPDRFAVTLSNGDIVLVRSNGIFRRKNFSNINKLPVVTGTISTVKGECLVFGSTNGEVYLTDENLNVLPGFPFATNGEIKNVPALADIDKDGQRDIIVFSGNKIWAINAAGAVLDNFPIIVSTDKTILTSPIIADIDGDIDVDIVAVTQEGLVVAYDKNGEIAKGLPLQAGRNGGSTPAVFPTFDGYTGRIGIAVAGVDGYVYTWHLGFLPEFFPPSIRWYNPWSQYMHDAQNTGLVEDASVPNPRSNEFLPTSLAYNWPNPVGAEHNFKTHIRYFLSEDASVEIKILDLAGDLVTTLNAQGTGGLDNEIEWDVSNIESGIYFARIEAKGASQSGMAIIKIAVVK